MDGTREKAPVLWLYKSYCVIGSGTLTNVNIGHVIINRKKTLQKERMVGQAETGFCLDSISWIGFACFVGPRLFLLILNCASNVFQSLEKTLLLRANVRPWEA
jgi:hypothetical protein